jgi:CheY-like chemotaxis protein
MHEQAEAMRDDAGPNDPATGIDPTLAEHEARGYEEFLAILGHELRNPLAPIVTALDLLRLRQTEQPSKEMVIIERQVSHMRRLVDDLLDASAVLRGRVVLKLKPARIDDVVALALDEAGPLLEERKHRVSVCVERGVEVNADATRLVQVVVCLLHNAAKYTPVGGRIAVRVLTRGNRVELEVEDDGMGIEPALLPRIFELFVQGERGPERAEGGLGIGLTLARSLVALHHGKMVARSAGPGKGSRFMVSLPQLASATDLEDKTARSRPARGLMTRKILVVDDNEDAAELLGDLLETLGHDVRRASDGPHALALLQDFAPDLAFLDIGLPVMDGYELAQQMRARLGSKCRLIALTGYGQDSDREKTQAAGFAKHLVKPIDLSQIRETLAA